MISRYPWYPNIHDIQISMISKYPCLNSLNVGHTSHMWSHLSHVVTLVTYGHTWHMWSHLSHVVTLVTCGHTCHKKSRFQRLTKKCIRCLTWTRPTYRPAWPQVKTGNVIPVGKQEANARQKGLHANWKSFPPGIASRCSTTPIQKLNPGRSSRYD